VANSLTSKREKREPRFGANYKQSQLLVEALKNEISFFSFTSYILSQFSDNVFGKLKVESQHEV